MANKKKPSLTVYNVKTFRDFSHIQSILNTRYDGEMPLNMYKGFLKAISNPKLKECFVRTFKPKSHGSVPPINSSPKKKESKFAQSATSPRSSKKTSPLNSSTKSVFTVKATDFSFDATLMGPHLVFRTHKSFCYVRKEWFQPRVLKSIDRSFKIRLSDYVGFTFVPQSDKQVFLNLLEQTYLEVEQEIYKEQLYACLNSVENYITSRVNDYIRNCQNIKFETNLYDYSFNEEKQVYIYKFNALEYLGINSNGVRLHVPLSSILERSDEEYPNKFHNEITSEYPDGYITVVDIDKLFPNHTSLDITVVIPKLFIDRFGKDNAIGIKAVYFSYLGIFKGWITSHTPRYWYQTNTSEVVFSDDIKHSLINIMRNIDSKFIITFYTAFIYMFNEGDLAVQSKYEKQLELELLKSQEEDPDFIYYWANHERFCSGYVPLLPFDTDNTSDWLWLTTQMKNGVFLNAYSFIDRDETFSSKCRETVKDSVKVYLTVKDASYTYRNHLGQFIFVDKIIISMYALDTAKSIYRFVVKKDKINEAIFYIWSYFSSNNYNKRQDFEYILYFKEYFGIMNFYKDRPLEYRSGIGYCDRKWLTDIEC